MRIVIFMWMIVFPIIFVAIPALEMFQGERAVSLAPIWAFVVWILGPAAVAVLLKHLGKDEEPTA